MPQKTPDERNTQPFLDHDKLTQAEQAKFLGVKEETTCNLGHRVPVSQLTQSPVSGYPSEYIKGVPNGFITESDKGSHGVYHSFKDAQSGLSTPENLSRWAGYASANSRVGPTTMKQPQYPEPDKRSLYPFDRDKCGKGGGHRP